MTSAFPTRFVDKTDPEYQTVPRFHFVLVPKPGGNTAHEFLQVTEDLKSGIEAMALSNSVPHISADGQELTLDFLKEQVAHIISQNPTEWVSGCDGLFILYHPDKREKLVSILSKLPVSPQANCPRKLLSVRYKEDVLAFEVDLHENRLISEDSLVIGLANPSDPAAEYMVESDRGEALRMTDFYATKQNSEYFAIGSLCRDLTLHRNYSPEGLKYRYEPLGNNTFPDFELIVGDHEWAVEVTRIESEMVSYVKVDREVEKGKIERAVQSRITDSGVNKALSKALSEKTEKRNKCSSYSRYCLLLVDVVDSVGGKDSAVWNGIDLSAFDAIVLIKLDGSVYCIKGGNAFE